MTEITLKRVAHKIVDIKRDSFVAVAENGEPDFFTNEEVHPAERHRIKVGEQFTLHHLYRIEPSTKTKAQRVEFTSPWPPPYTPEPIIDPCVKNPCSWCRSGGRTS